MKKKEKNFIYEYIKIEIKKSSTRLFVVVSILSFDSMKRLPIDVKVKIN